MYNNSKSRDFRVRPRFEKPVFPFPRNPVNFYRRPGFPLRRHMMSGRYPNTGHRPFAPPIYRPNRPSVPRGAAHDFILRDPPNACPLPTQPIQRPQFLDAPVNNMFDNRTNQFSPRPPAVNYDENQIVAKSSETRNIENELNMFPELWIEALAPGGRKYYYNARTRDTAWDRPMNGRIIDLDEINRLRNLPGEEYQQNQPNGNKNVCVPQQTSTLYCNPFDPNICPMPPRIIVFPPPQNMYIPPQILPPSLPEGIQGTTNCIFNPSVPPPVFSYPNNSGVCIPNNFYVTNQAVDCNTCIPFEEVNNDTGPLESQTFTDNEEFEHIESKISDWSVSESQTSLCLSDNAEESETITETVSEKIEERSEEHATNTVDPKMENEVVQYSETEHSRTETEYVPPEDSAEIEHEPQVNKSRPVSSTNVPGTCWFVVWTGDEKVFFFDSHNKVSFWEKPNELSNRADVDKLTEKPPLPPDLKNEKKEVRKTIFEGSEIVKKLKTGGEDVENSSTEQNVCEEVPEEKIEEKGEKPKSVAMPHKKKVQMFCEMLAEKNVSAFSSWEKELHKIVYDSRYLLLSSKERRHVYDTYVFNKIEEDKKNRQKEYRRQRENFTCLLKEASLNSKSRFNDFVQRYGKDVRFKSVEKIKQREFLFNHYVSELAKKEREKAKEQKKLLLELLSEQTFINKDSTWSVVQKHISNDERYKAIQSNSLKEKIFNEYVKENLSRTSPGDKQERIIFSLRNREDEVKRDLTVHLMNREREQEFHKRNSAISNFKALLNDLIREPDIGWNSAKKRLKVDHRWNYVQCLESEEREELFELHIESLNSKKKEQFQQLLDDIPNITLKTSWLDIRKLALKDPRCSRFSTSERKCEKEFKDYLRGKFQSAKQNFRELLQETKMITHKSKSLLGDTNHLKDIEEILSKDQRYLNLDCFRSERKDIILSYIDKLHEEGSPPPPTATDPSFRPKIKM